MSVTLDTVNQVQGHLFAQQYEGLIAKSKLRKGKRTNNTPIAPTAPRGGFTGGRGRR